MEKRKRKFLAGGFLFTCIVGTALHFVYEWSGKNPVIGLFAPVSESTWEHLKLLFFPAALWAAVGSMLLRKSMPGILEPCTAGICTGMLFVVTFFYTYTGIWGTHWTPADVLTFYAGVLVTYRVSGRKWSLFAKRGGSHKNGLAAAVLLAIMLCFFLFTYYVPPIGLFRIP